ncbi:transposase family protein [Dactylosporangium fulvum]|uniref:Transposase family protein n=1 Tax=Dactylosporangium fulvum TaxID=53359 RepID=A0ABY5VXB9_9ACTN|nr:transposase family protein [Dactylosporangium fulvum]UWP81771.1 transposase family protein [Dactylosporangium fulvum]
MASSLISALAVTAPTSIGPAAPVTDGEHGGLLHVLAAVPDPRDPRGVRYPLTALLAVAVCAVLAGHRPSPRSRTGCTTWTNTRSGSRLRCYVRWR